MSRHVIRVFLAGFVLALAILAYGPSQAQTGSAQLAVQDASVKPIGKVVTTTGSVTIEHVSAVVV